MSKLNIIHFETLPSTNTYAKENAEKLLLPALIIADGQTNGRGRRGKSFFSPSGTGLYMTLVFKAPGKYLLLVFVKDGKLVYDLPSLDQIRHYCHEQMESLWDEIKRFDNPQTYYVDLSQKLWDIKYGLLENHGKSK